VDNATTIWCDVIMMGPMNSGDAEMSKEKYDFLDEFRAARRN
jgi:hypothetical protein